MLNWQVQNHFNSTVHKAKGIRYCSNTQYFNLFIERASKTSRRYKFRFYCGFILAGEVKETHENDEEAKDACTKWFYNILKGELEVLESTV